MIQAYPSSFARYTAPKITLPRIAPDMQEALTLLSRCQLRGQITLGEDRWEATPVCLYRAGHARGTRLTLKIGGVPAQLDLLGDLLDVVPALALLDKACRDLAPELLALTVEHVLSPSFAALEAAWGMEVHLTRVALSCRIPLDQHLVAWHLQPDGPGTGLFACLNAPEPLRCAELFAQRAPQKAATRLEHLSVPVTLLGPVSMAEREEIAGLAPGSAFFPDPDWRGKTSLIRALRVGDAVVPIRQQNTGQFCQSGPVQALATRPPYPLEGGANPMPSDPDLVDHALVELSIELARRQVPLSQLAALQEGGVLPLDLEQVGAVTVMANGAPLAEGRLVQLDESLGVQVTRML